MNKHCTFTVQHSVFSLGQTVNNKRQKENTLFSAWFLTRKKKQQPTSGPLTLMFHWKHHQQDTAGGTWTEPPDVLHVSSGMSEEEEHLQPQSQRSLFYMDSLKLPAFYIENI